MQPADWVKTAACTARISTASLHVIEGSDLTLMKIRTKARRLQQRHGLALIIVDYLQLMTPGTHRRNDNRQQEAADMSRGLKLLVKDLNVPVVALSQLNRASEQRSDKRPCSPTSANQVL